MDNDQELGKEVARELSPMFLNLSRKIAGLEMKPNINVAAPKIPEIKIPKIDSPEVKIPEIKIPEIVIPEIKVPQSIVNVDVDKVRITNLDEIPAPSELNIDGIVKPIVKAIKDFSGGGGSGAGAMEFYEETSAKYVSPSATNPLPVSATLNVGDIEIGAVEIKDATTDTRATVGANGLYVHVRASALPTGAATSALQETGNTYLDGINDSLLSLSGAGSPMIDSYQTATITSKTGANQLIVSSAADKQIWVYGFGFSGTVAGTVAFQDEDDTVLTGAMNIADTGGFVSSPSGNFAMPLFKLATNKDLEMDIVTTTINGWVAYAIVSV